MKFCPYCGADLIDGAASFCPECGKAIPDKKQQAPQKTKTNAKTDKQSLWRRLNGDCGDSHSEPQEEDEPDDGYYDDVQPEDQNRVKQGIDKRLVIKIIFLVAGVVLVAAAGISIMCLI